MPMRKFLKKRLTDFFYLNRFNRKFSNCGDSLEMRVHI